MDEADKLCDRIRDVDHGDLKALDSPTKLKMSVPSKQRARGSTSLDSARLDRPTQGVARVEDVSSEDSVFRISTRNGPATTMAMLDAAAAAGVSVHALAVQSTRSTMSSCTTPDGVFATRCKTRTPRIRSS